MMKKLYAFTVGILCSICLWGQFEGKVLYEVEYESEDPSMSAMLSMLPNQSSLLIKGDLLRFDQEIIGGGRQSFVIDGANNSNTLLMNFMGQEFRVSMNEDEVAQLQQAEEVRMEKGDESLSIEGYECEHLIAITSEDTLNVFYTPEIATPAILPQFAAIKGLPLKYEMVKGKVKMTYTCIGISSGALSIEEFNIPSSIKEIPFKDFAENFAIMK